MRRNIGIGSLSSFLCEHVIVSYLILSNTSGERISQQLSNPLACESSPLVLFNDSAGAGTASSSRRKSRYGIPILTAVRRGLSSSSRALQASSSALELWWSTAVDLIA